MASFRRKACINGLLGVLFCLALIALIAPPAYAQETTGTIEGRVSDATGGRVPGATVKAESAVFTREALTDDFGAYRFLQVPPGKYKVTASMTGFNTSLVDVDVTVGKIVAVDFSLKVGDMSEQVIVSADSVAKIDPARSSIETNITNNVIDIAPKGTNLTSLLKLSQATRYESNAGGYQVDGASGSENSWVIDGLEVSNFRTGVLNQNNNVPFAMVEEVLVKTSGFNAEFGGATGGVVNVITKSGTNDFHGQAGYEIEPSSLFARPRPYLYRFRSGSGASFTQINQYVHLPKDDFKGHFPSFSIGGPLVKDRMWFFTSYAPQIENRTRTTTYYPMKSADILAAKTIFTGTTTSHTYTRQTRSDYFQGRLDTSPTDTLRVTGTYIWNPYQEDGVLPQDSLSLGGAVPVVNFGGAVGTLTGNDLTSRQGGRNNSTNVSTQAIWTPTSNIAGSFRYARGYLNEKLSSYFKPEITRFRCINNAPPSGAGCNLGMDTLPTGNNQIFRDISIRNNFEGDFSYIVSNFGGRHEIKTGYQHAKVSNDVANGYVPFGRVDLSYGYTINDLTGRDDPVSPNAIGAGLLIRFGTVGEASNTSQSLYFQDRWQPIQRLSLNAGIRMEKEDLPSFNGYAPPINFGWFDKVVPRLGFAFDLTNDGKSKIFASYARFQDRLRFELPRGSFGGDFYRVDYFEIMPDHANYDYYTLAKILGSNPDVLGGKCPISGGSGLSKCQYDYRIASNDPSADIYTGKVDPNMKPLTQEEFTAGYERELTGSHLLGLRYSYKNVLHAIEDAGFPTPEGSEAYIIGNPGEGLHAETAKMFGYAKTTKPVRRYDAVEVRLDKRFTGKYNYNLSYTWSRLYGNYSGLASSDEAGRTSPGVNRFFDLPHIGFTAAGVPDNGPLPTDRPHSFKAMASYDFDWFGRTKGGSTLFSMFTTAQSGTPITSYYTLYAAAVLYGRGDRGRTPIYTNTDFAVSHRIKAGERYEARFDITLTNMFNESNVLGVISNPSYVSASIAGLNLPASVTGEPEALNYVLTNGIISNFNTFLNDPTAPQRKDTAIDMPSAYQGGRTIRLGVRFSF
ncbi:MAG: TonB-dependent receptor [Acidobacteria bacterium]|nr:MAG: TonB-dependent receptor [Acidobacteriota bacterium]